MPDGSFQPAALYVEPDAGKPTTLDGPVVSIVQPKLAGVASEFPAASLARTSKVCAPCASPV